MTEQRTGETTNLVSCESVEFDGTVNLNCQICSMVAEDAVSVICGHWFCSRCLEKYFLLVQRVPKVCPVCGYSITDEKHLSYVDRELQLSNAERFYRAWTYKYQLYSDFPQGEWDNWSSAVNDEDNFSVVDAIDDSMVEPNPGHTSQNTSSLDFDTFNQAPEEG